MKIKVINMGISPEMATNAVGLSTQIFQRLENQGRNMKGRMGIIVLALSGLLLILQKEYNINPAVQMHCWAESVNAVLSDVQNTPGVLSFLNEN